MKDGLVVQTDYTSEDSTFIQEVSLEDTGSYVCRASNDYSAIYSPVATLLVKGKTFKPLKTKSAVNQYVLYGRITLVTTFHIIVLVLTEDFVVSIIGGHP